MSLTLKQLKKLRATPPWEWPEDSAAGLLEVLRSSTPREQERLLAVELAGDLVVISDELVAELLATLARANEPERVRSSAALSLGPLLEQCDVDGFDDPDSVPVTEESFNLIQERMRALYLDAAVPKLVRRRILEGSVRAPRDWHRDAVRAAYASDDEDWRLTAVFCMRFVRGFDEQILEALGSKNRELHREAVLAAGEWGIDAAWPHVSSLVANEATPKSLLLAAIEAVGGIRPQEAAEALDHLTDSDDPEIADAVMEVTSTAELEGTDDPEEGERGPAH